MSQQKARVAVLMGSDSDWEVMAAAVDRLEGLGIVVDVHVMSAHRTPARVAEYASSARQRGFQVMIVGAGAAAHLAGVVAAHTDLPVIGIPMDNPPLGGLDALLSTAQMPGGVPVAAVGAGAGGPVNAALFAARILALSDPALALRYAAWREEETAKVGKKDAALQTKLAQ
jgi:5-(carboxyamino)imidazole ribonucleotide mutase